VFLAGISVEALAHDIAVVVEHDGTDARIRRGERYTLTRQFKSAS
jgi:hypothetical protein